MIFAYHANLRKKKKDYFSLTRDLYVSLGEPVGDGAWGVRIYHKPFIDWIWGGAFLMALGGVLAICDRRYRAGKRVSETNFTTEGVKA